MGTLLSSFILLLFDPSRSLAHTHPLTVELARKTSGLVFSASELEENSANAEWRSAVRSREPGAVRHGRIELPQIPIGLVMPRDDADVTQR